MKHYFYFKKGQMVPQWLLRQRDANTKEVLPVAQFRVNGKVMVDDKTGDAIIWPASKRFQHIIYGYGYGREVLLDTDDAGSMNNFYGYSDRRTTTVFGVRHGDSNCSPLTSARRLGVDIFTTTKCSPIPENFSRRQSVAVNDMKGE